MASAPRLGRGGPGFESQHSDLMSWFLYILQSTKSKKYYIGSIDNLARRLYEHNTGKNKSTKNKGLWKIIYTEKFDTRLEVRRRELKIKSYKGGNAFKKLIGK